MKIKKIYAREIFDSRGIPTVECNLFLSDGTMITASVPSGTSCGKHEAVELRDGGNRLMGLGVRTSVSIINDVIAPALIETVPDISEADKTIIMLDGTKNKSRLGAQAMLATSIVICRAHAYLEGLEVYELLAQLCGYETVAMPAPMFNFLGGGAHAHNHLDIQEYLFVPTSTESFHENFDAAIAVFYTLQEILRAQGKLTGVGLEGGFVPNFNNNFQALDCLMEAIEKSGNSNNGMISLDIASSQLYDSNTQLYRWGNAHVAAHDLIEIYEKLIATYPIYSIEDGLAEDDWNGWKIMNDLIGDRVQLIGDDLFATSPERICYGIEHDVATAALIKPNQIGTITETLQAITLCKENEWEVIVSHRSGETNDSFIADLAVGVSAEYIKAGGCSRGERMAKYNRLLTIENQFHENLL